MPDNISSFISHHSSFCITSTQLLTHRRTLRLTQSACAAMLGFSQQRYCVLEHNGVWNLRTAKRIRRILGII